MPRYVEIDDVEVSDYVTVWDCNCSEFGKQTVMAVDDLQYLPTADVVPKSEVEATVEKLMSATDKVICEAKAEVAREIFEKIDKGFAEMYPYFSTQLMLKYIAELKKKYTEGEE